MWESVNVGWGGTKWAWGVPPSYVLRRDHGLFFKRFTHVNHLLTPPYHHHILVYMSTTLPALYDTHFDPDMLRDIALLNAPHQIAEQYGYDYERIKDLPNFKAQLARVEAELFNDGTITRTIAEIGLNKAVEEMALRVAAGTISNEDLNKFTNTLHKVTNRDADKNTASNKPQFSIEINLGSDTLTLTGTKKLKDVTDSNDVIDVEDIEDVLDKAEELRDLLDAKKPHTSAAGEIPILDDLDDDMEDIPSDLLDNIRSTSDFGLDID
jgi:hypothetical protein